MLKQTLLVMSRQAWLKRAAMRVPMMRRVAARFVAGEHLADVVPAVRALNARGLTATVDHLGEHVTDPGEAESACREYLDLLETLRREKLDANVSIKLTEVGLDIDRGLARALVLRVVDRARECGSFVRLDMESSSYTQVTLDLFHEIHERHPQHVGIVLQAYLHRTEADLAKVLTAGARVRLCKGAYDEPATVAFPDKAMVDAQFVARTRTLLDSGIYHGIGTHDPAMVHATLEHARARKHAPDAFEFQMLYGVRRDLQDQLVKDGWRMRVYVPYGLQWYPYLMRRMAERPANLLFVMRSMTQG